MLQSRRDILTQSARYVLPRHQTLAALTFIETLASLVSKSLVCAQSFAGKTRYQLLNTTRAYEFEKRATDGMLNAVVQRPIAHHCDNGSGKEG